jgi:hypothetical protein
MAKIPLVRKVAMTMLNRFFDAGNPAASGHSQLPYVFRTVYLM